MFGSAETINELQKYLDDYGHTAFVRGQYRHQRNRNKTRLKAWKRNRVKDAVDHAKKCGILPTSWLAWMVIKLAVEAFLRRHLFSESGANQ